MVWRGLVSFRVPGALLRPPQYRPNPGKQLARFKGFRNVVIGAHLQADNPVHSVAAAGHHDDRHVGFRPDLSGELQDRLPQEA